MELIIQQKLKAWEKLYQGFEEYFNSRGFGGLCALILEYSYDMNLTRYDKSYLMQEIANDIQSNGVSTIHLFTPILYEPRKEYILGKINKLKIEIDGTTRS